MERKFPIDNPDSLKRSRNSRAPAESRNLRETGRHVPKHFDDAKREPELEPLTEELPKKPFGLSCRKAHREDPGGSRN